VGRVGRLGGVGGVGRVNRGDKNAMTFGRVERFPYSAYSACLTALIFLVGAGALRAQADHGAQYSQSEIAAGYALYTAQCTQCHGPNGDTVSGIDLRRGVFKRVATDEDLARIITAGVAGAGMPPFTLQPAELTGIVAYLRAGFDQTASIRVGDAARGRAIFEGKGGCTSCHRVSGRGPLIGPDLSSIGLARTLSALQRSLLDPSAAMIPLNRPVRAVTRSGETVRGRRLNEDTFTVQILDSQSRLRSFEKRDLRSLDVETTSPMPSFASRLSADEIADVIGYLVTLRER
jgi:cytochrome c oxidase cbb3-type subunit III